jgi:hypothetical protein
MSPGPTTDSAENTNGGTAVAETRRPEQSATTYLGFVFDTTTNQWNPIPGARVTVNTGRADLAKQKYLERLNLHEDIREVSIAVVSERAWLAETFEREEPKPPQFKPKSA